MSLLLTRLVDGINHHINTNQKNQSFLTNDWFFYELIYLNFQINFIP